MPRLSTREQPATMFDADEQVEDIISAMEANNPLHASRPVEPEPEPEPEPAPEPEPEPEPVDPDPDLGPTSYHIDGYDFTEDELRTAISSHFALASLSPSQVEALNRVLTGEDVAPPPSAAGGSSPAPPSTPVSTPPDDNDDEILDPILAARIRQLEASANQRISTLEEQLRTQASRDLATQRSALLADLNVASEAFATDRHLTSLQMDQLQNTVAEYSLVAALRQRMPSASAQTLMSEALDRAYRMEFFDTAVQSAAQQTLDTSQDQLTAARERKTRAAALSGPTGSMSRQLPSQEVRGLKGQQLTDAIANIVRETGS